MIIFRSADVAADDPHLLMLMTLFVVITGWLAICTAWAGLLVAQFRAKQRGVFLAALSPDSEQGQVRDARWPTVCVVIPARNEGSRIAKCLASVLALDHPALDVLVVDDRSEDDTDTVAARMAEADPRLRMVRNDCLPEGWLGKSYALWRATESRW